MKRSPLYNLRSWRTMSKHFLRAHPWCAYCLELGIHRPAEVVDHKTPHNGDRVLFFEQNNWQSLCNPCHSGPKRREDHAQGKRAPRPGCDINGLPLDPCHEWNAPQCEPHHD